LRAAVIVQLDCVDFFLASAAVERHRILDRKLMLIDHTTDIMGRNAPSRVGFRSFRSALNTAECIGGTAPVCAGGTLVRRDANDGYQVAARVRLAF